MAFGFGKKGNEGKHAAEAASAPANKKKRGHMSKVLRESVLESALATFQESPNLKFEAPDGVRYLGWLLNTAEIGGLTEKDKKNEDKGSLIEAINHGAIDVMITKTLLDNELICFIPSERTLEAMEEFPMLVGAKYHPYTVPIPMTGRSCEGDLDAELTFAQAKACVAGTVSAAVLAGVEAPEPMAPTEVFEPVVAEEPVVEAAPAMDDVDMFGGEPEPAAPFEPEVEIETTAYSYEEDLDFGNGGWGNDSIPMDEPMFEDEMPSYDDYDVADEEDEAEVESDVMDLTGIEEAAGAAEEAYTKTVNRVFYSGDLDIETPMDAFDAMFVCNNEFIPFPTDRGDGWLADQLSDMSRVANTELARLHDENIRAARAEFMEQCGLLAQRVAKSLDIDDADTLFGSKRLLIDDLMSEALAHRSEHVERQRSEVDAEWNASIENVAKEASDAAAASYKRRYSEQHALELARVQDLVEESIRNQHGDAMRKLNDERRAMAAKMMEHGTSEILSLINAKYQVARDKEDVEYKRHLEAIRQFADAEKENELIRIRVLDEENRQLKALETTRNELNGKLETERREAMQREEALKSEIERLRTQAADDARMRESVYSKHVTELEDRMADTEKRAQAADERAGSIEMAVEARHAQIHADQTAMITRLTDELDAMTAARARMNVIMLAGYIVVMLGSLAIGGAVGANIVA